MRFSSNFPLYGSINVNKQNVLAADAEMFSFIDCCICHVKLLNNEPHALDFYNVATSLCSIIDVSVGILCIQYCAYMAPDRVLYAA